MRTKGSGVLTYLSKNKFSPEELTFIFNSINEEKPQLNKLLGTEPYPNQMNKINQTKFTKEVRIPDFHPFATSTGLKPFYKILKLRHFFDQFLEIFLLPISGMPLVSTGNYTWIGLESGQC